MSDIAKRLDDLEHVLWGNSKPGLIRDVDKIKGDLYANPSTGAPGLVADVRQIKTMVTELKGGVAFAKAVVTIAAGLLVIVQVLDKFGVFAAFRGGP